MSKQFVDVFEKMQMNSIKPQWSFAGKCVERGVKNVNFRPMDEPCAHITLVRGINRKGYAIV